MSDLSKIYDLQFVRIREEWPGMKEERSRLVITPDRGILIPTLEMAKQLRDRLDEVIAMAEKNISEKQ